jgi:hypothetical protein
MSQLFAAPSIESLLFVGRAVSLIVAFLIFAWAFRHWRRAAIKDTQRVFEQLDLVRSELLIMREVMHHAAHRVDSVAHQVTQETRLTQPAASGAARGYEIAARMARNGAAKDELIKSCGLTAHEAELLIKLHGQKQNPVETIGRQVRQPSATQSSKAATATRQASAPAETRRTERSAQTAVPRQPQRSRLVAVG